MEPQIEIEVDPLAIYREQVAAEKESKPSVMSDKAAERLKQISYEDKVTKQSEEKFAYGLTQIAATPENLTKLIARCSGSPRQLDRRTQKLLFWIQGRGYRLGHEIRLPEDITFLSELTSDEIAMSDAVFAATWKVKKIVQPISDEPEPRYCPLKRQCLRFKNGKPGVIPGTGEYCSTDCRGRAKWQKKASAGKATVQ
jgi:hypothetical protein